MMVMKSLAFLKKISGYQEGLRAGKSNKSARMATVLAAVLSGMGGVRHKASGICH
jgi:hypothetical protein